MRSADTKWAEMRGSRATGHGPRESNALIRNLRRRCRRPLTMLMRSSLGQQRGEKHGLRSPTTQPRQVRTAWRACSVGSWPLLHGAKSALAARHGIRARWPKPPTAHAIGVSRCWCDRASADSIQRTAPRVGPQHNCAKSMPCGVRTTYVVVRHKMDRTRAGRAPRESSVVIETLRSRCRRSRGVGAVKPRPTVRRGARPAFAHDTSTPSPHCVARVLCGRLVLAPRSESAWATSHGIQTRGQEPIAACAADLPRCWRGRASANGTERRAPRVSAQHNRAMSVLCGVRAPYAVGRHKMGRNVRRSRATGVERGDQKLAAKAVPLTSRGVGAIGPRPTAWREARPACCVRPRHNHAKFALRGARAPWAVGPCSTGRKARWPRATGLERGGH